MLIYAIFLPFFSFILYEYKYTRIPTVFSSLSQTSPKRIQQPYRKPIPS